MQWGRAPHAERLNGGLDGGGWGGIGDGAVGAVSQLTEVGLDGYWAEGQFFGDLALGETLLMESGGLLEVLLTVGWGEG